MIDLIDKYRFSFLVRFKLSTLVSEKHYYLKNINIFLSIFFCKVNYHSNSIPYTVAREQWVFYLSTAKKKKGMKDKK